MKTIRKTCRIALGLLLFPLVLSAATYKDLQRQMQDRQAAVEDLLKSLKIGESLDGTLKVPPGAPAMTKAEQLLVEAENKDRLALFGLMAQDLSKSPKAVADEFVARYQARWKKGILREVINSAGQPEFWDGNPTTDPRIAGPTPPELQMPPRVLTIDSASLYQRPSTVRVVRSNIPDFSAYSVIQVQRGADGIDYFQVTVEQPPLPRPADWDPTPVGWISGAESVPWHHSLVMKFTSPSGRDPSLFFELDEDLHELVPSPAPARKTKLDEIRDAIRANGQPPAGSSAVGIEPSINPTTQEDAVIIPILAFQGVELDGHRGKFLELAALTDKSGLPPGPSEIAKFDVVFAMDTTGSMGPYLEALKEATAEFVRAVDDKDIQFGFVGYRDDPDLDPRLEYAVKNFTKTGLLPESEFLNVLDQVEPVTDSRGFPIRTNDSVPEAVFLGVQEAIRNTGWRPNSIRIIMLIGDAPGHKREKITENLSGQDEVTLRKEAERALVNIFAVHLRGSDFSKSGDQLATRQFEEISRYAGQGTSRGSGQAFFNQIDASNQAGFRKRVDDVYAELTQIITELPGIKTQDDIVKRAETDEDPDLFRVLLENAVIDWLGRQNTERPEDYLRAWASERFMPKPELHAMKPYLLIRRRELDALADRLEGILATARQSAGQPNLGLSLFELLQQNTGWTLKDPSAVQLGEAFGMPDGLELVPYKSPILSMTNNEWRSMAGDQQDQFFGDIETMLKHYENLRRNADVWRPLTENAPPSEWVALLELDMLP